VDLNKFDILRFAQHDIDTLKKTWGCDGQFIITLPGRLTRWKGQIPFLRALYEIKDDLSWHAFLVGGAGKKQAYKEELEALIVELGLEKRVTLTGGQSDIPPFYAMSDVIVSASIEPEAFGRVAIEAGSMKKPVIATAHGGSLETVKNQETGRLVPAGDSKTMAKILRGFIKDKGEAREMGEKAYTWVKNTFTVERMCRTEWLAYLKVLGEK
jgi:glycosyltransferase involved in cell wall biosynthesis